MVRANNRSLPMTRGIFSASVLTVLLVCEAPNHASAQPGPQPEGILTATDAYLMLPPELISGPVVNQLTRSPSGRNVAVQRVTMRITPENVPSAAVPRPLPPMQEYELIFWNSGVRKPVSLWQTAQPFTSVQFTDWMPTTESLYAVVDRSIPPDPAQPPRPPAHEWKVLLLGNGIERAVPLAVPLGDYSQVRIQMSPRKALGVLDLISGDVSQTEALYLLHPNGRIGARIDIPAAGRYGITWDPEGTPAIVSFAVGQGARPLGLVDVRSGRILPMPKETAKPDPVRTVAEPQPLRIVTRRHNIVESETTHTTNPIWLESPTKSDNPRAMLTADGRNAAFVPGGAGVLYQSQNAAWFTPIMKIPKEAYIAARRAAQRMVALSNAKQLGLATMMFAQDNDEVLPGPDGVEAKLSPYLGNTELFAGFTYTFAGGALSEVVSPAETVLGHVVGPGGRAVVFVDGHAKWINDGP